jgi:glycosyltransferase involved in cell wall biosynthesis
MKNIQPLVSVIVNCHNGENFLTEALDSIFSQTYTNFEIIFWDNASTDATSNIAKRFMSRDRRLKYFFVKKMTSLGEARVLAINEANGELLSFLDCDDVWMPSKLEKQVSLFVNSSYNVGFVYSRCMIISKKGDRIGEINQLQKKLATGEIFGELVKSNFIPFVSALVSKKKYYEVGGFPISYVNSTDYDLFLKLSFNYYVLAVDEVLCKYREHGDNRSHSQYVIGAKEALESVYSFLPDRRAKNGLRFQRINLIIAYIKVRKFKDALFLLLRYGGLIILIRRFIFKLRF